jgi:hypothetical protein
MTTFRNGDTALHVRTGNLYQIVLTPDDGVCTGSSFRESQERYNSQEKARRQHCAELSRIYSDDSVRVTFFAECIR